MSNASLPRTAFLGLGVMGYPMAGHLARSGYPVTVYNRTGEKSQAWLTEYQNGQFQIGNTPAEAAAALSASESITDA